MANKTVSNLNELTTVSNSDVLLVETATETLKVTKGNLLKEVNQQLNDKSDANHTHREYITEDELNSKGLATESFVTQKIAEASFGDASESATVLIEPNENDIPKVFFEGDIDGMSKTNEKILRFSYISRTKTISGYVKMKWQGTSSLGYPKKNFTIKMFTDETCETKDKHTFKNWNYKTNKYVLKANYIDHSHARNIVSARLWGDIVASRTDYDSLPTELKSSPNNGAVDGFPIKLYMNGKYEGLYTWNIGKEGWTYGMTDDENPNYAVLCGEDYNSGCFRALANINGSDWSLEYPDVLQNPIKQSWNNAISFVMNNNGTAFKNGLSTYFDVNSLIDYYIFAYFSCGLDSMGKNQIYTTYDGTKWYANMYDMDSTWGLYYNGNSFVPSNYKCQENYETMVNGRLGNLLYQKLEENFFEEICDRYQALRDGALSLESVINRFERFTDIISNDLYDEDGLIYTGIPSRTTNNVRQIRTFLKDRSLYVDENLDASLMSIESISIQSTSGMIVGGTRTLEVTYIPTNTKLKGVTWSSNRQDIATVDETSGLITAVSAGECVITATSKVNPSITASCVLTVAQKQTTVTDAIYELSSMSFDGNLGIDTGVKLFDSDKDFTIYIDVTGNDSGVDKTVLHCMMESNPYPGLAFDLYSNKYRFAYGEDTYLTSYYSSSKENQRYIITKTSGSGIEVYDCNTRQVLKNLYKPFVSFDKNLMIGSYKDEEGNLGRYWKGTVNRCIVWEKIVTKEEVNSILGVQ